MPNTAQLVESFCRTANDILPTVFTPDCCLNGTRVVMEGLRAIGIRVEPVSVYAVAYNKAYLDLANELERLPTTEEMQADPREPWALGTDVSTDSSEGWPGHLVAVVDDRWLVDAAAGQLSRPQRSIFVPSVVMTDCPSRFARRGTITLTLPEGGKLEYKARKFDRSYEGISGFQRSPHNLRVARLILDTMAAEGSD